MPDDLLENIKNVAGRAASDKVFRGSTNVQGKPLERGLKRVAIKHAKGLLKTIIDKIFSRKKAAKKINPLNADGYPKILDFYVALASNGFNAFKILQSYQFCLTIQFPGQTPKFFSKRNENTKFLESMGFERYGDKQIIPLLVRSAELPNFITEPNVEPVVNEYGYASFSSKGNVITDSNRFTVSFLSTEFSIHENLFLGWMKETMSNTYQYFDHPYSTATIRVDFFDQEHKMTVFSYVFESCFPVIIDTVNPNFEIDNLTLSRNVTFLFDWMRFETNLENIGTFPEPKKDYLAKRREPGFLESLLGDVFKTVGNEASRRVSEKYKINF